MKKYLVLLFLMVSMVASAAVYKITGTDNYVNGLPTNLSTAERNKLITLSSSDTDAIAEANAPYNDVSRAQAKAIVKSIILAETTCPSGYEGTPPNCTLIPPPPTQAECEAIGKTLNAAGTECEDLPPPPPPPSTTPALDAISFSALFDATPQADREKFETVLANLDSATTSDIETTVAGMNQAQKDKFVLDANAKLAITALPSNSSQIDALGNSLYAILTAASTYTPPPAQCATGYTGTPPNCIIVCEAGFEPNGAGDACVAVTPPPPPSNNMPVVDISKQFTPAVGFSTIKISPNNDPLGNSTTGGDFRIHCAPSHQNNDDPIVYPNQQGAAHHHTFFGNTGTNYQSTPASLKTTGNSTCQGGIANRSAYWMPSLINTTTNTPLKPAWALFYYKGGSVKPPNGLVMIAGDHMAKPSNPQNIDGAQWQCNELYSSRSNSIPACNGDLTAIVHFPNCWDGVNLDSPNHKSHLAYDMGNGCPASHPNDISNISGIVHYNVSGTSNLRLASDNYAGGAGGHSLHMDYMFGWDDTVLDTWWQNCNGADKDCHADLLGNGTWLAP